MENSNMLRMGGSNPPLPKTTCSRAGNALLKSRKKWSNGQVSSRKKWHVKDCKSLQLRWLGDCMLSNSDQSIAFQMSRCLVSSLPTLNQGNRLNHMGSSVDPRIPHSWRRGGSWWCRWIETPVTSRSISTFLPISTYFHSYLLIYYVYMYIIYKIFTTLHWNILKELK